MTGMILSHTCRQGLRTRSCAHNATPRARVHVRVFYSLFLSFQPLVSSHFVRSSRASLRNLDSSFRSRYGLCFQLTRGGTTAESWKHELKRPPQPCRRRDVNFRVSRRLFRLSALARIKSRIRTAYCSLCHVFYLLETLLNRWQAVPNQDLPGMDLA
jgi:hypothetical protein